MPNEKSTHKSTHIAKSHGLSRPFGKPTHKPKLGKECAYPNPRRNSIFFSLLMKILKHPTRKTNTTKTMKLNNDNGLQGQINRTTGYNTVLPKWREKCFYETIVQGSTVVFLLNFSANNPPLRQYPNRQVAPLCAPNS